MIRKNKPSFFFLSPFLTIIIFGCGLAETRLLLPPDISELAESIFSEGQVVQHVKNLSQYHRIAGGSQGYRKAAEYVSDYIQSLGPFRLEVKEHIADGDTLYLKWRTKPTWNLRRAELRLAGTKEILASYADVPVSVMVYSNGCEIEADAVYAGQGLTQEDYDGRNVRGKIVLATGPGYLVHQEAVIRRGAAGIVVGPPENDRLAQKYPDLVYLHRLKSNKLQRNETGFGFSLSRLQFNKLTSVIAEGRKLRLQAFIDADLCDGKEQTISAFLEGSEFPNKEIILSAHLDHYRPGANDNASGCATLLEIARCLSRLRDQGKTFRPKRSIRFLWVSEMHGFAGYLAQDPDIGERGIAGINLDMVGENTFKTYSVMNLVRTPFSNPSFISDLMEKTIKSLDETNSPGHPDLIPRMNFRFSSFETGSDHFMLTDPTIGVPSVNLGHAGDVFHHTSMDTMEMVDPQELRRSGLSALKAALITADAGEDTVLVLAADMVESGIKRMASFGRSQKNFLDQKSKQPEQSSFMGKHLKDSLIFLDVRCQVEVKGLRSLRELSSTPAAEDAIWQGVQFIESYHEMEKRNLHRYFSSLCSRMGIQTPSIRNSEKEKELKNIIPKRLFRGPISQYYLEDILGDRINWYIEYAKRDPLWVNRRTEILNFMDGKQNLLQIYYAVSAEFGRSDPSFFKEFTEDLRKHGLIEF